MSPHQRRLPANLVNGCQILVGLVFWGLFVASWVELIRVHSGIWTAVLASVQTVAVIAVLILAVTLAWVRHNMQIYRRKGPRTGTKRLPARVDADRLGRALRWDTPLWEASVADYLVIERSGGDKVYRARI
jgi:hypothetical protein